MKYIICFLYFFTASCVSTQKYHRTAQSIVDFAQRTIDGIHVTTGPRDTSCRHIWVAVEKDTICYGLPISSVYYPRGRDIACLRCLALKEQVVIQESNLKWRPGKIDTARWPQGPWIIPEPKKKP